MKILWFSTSSGDVFNIMASLDYLGQHEVKRFHYDSRWHEQAQQACMSNPQLRETLQAGGYKALGWPRERVAMDDDMIRHAENFGPDMILFTSAWEGLFCPTNATLAKLNTMAPVVHMLHDASDYPWWPQLAQFEIDKCFAATVNIDGGLYWPGGSKWDREPISNGVTVLTPVDPRPYQQTQITRVRDRMYALGYAGNRGGPIRSFLTEQVGRAIPSFVCRMREESPQTYFHYAEFLKQCRVVINVPWSGSNSAQHVKGRVVETGFAATCLLEWRNDNTRQWFTPRFHFEEYQGHALPEAVEDCIETARFLMDRPNRAEEIAMAHHYEVMTKHSPEVVWAKIFGAAGLPKAAERAADPSPAPMAVSAPALPEITHIQTGGGEILPVAEWAEGQEKLAVPVATVTVPEEGPFVKSGFDAVPHMAFVVPVWGPKYIRRFKDWSLPTLRQLGNFEGCGPCSLYVMTDEFSEKQLKEITAPLMADMQVCVIPLSTVKNSDTTRLHMEGMTRAMADHPDCAVCFLNADVVMSDGIWKTVREALDKGKRAVLTQGVPVTENLLQGSRYGTFPRLKPTDIVRMILDASDNGFALPQWTSPFPKHPTFLCWEFQGGFVMHSPHWYPLAIRPNRTPESGGSIDNDLLIRCGIAESEIEFIADSERGCFLSVEDDARKMWDRDGVPDMAKARHWYQSTVNAMTETLFKTPLVFRSSSVAQNEIDAAIASAKKIVDEIAAKPEAKPEAAE